MCELQLAEGDRSTYFLLVDVENEIDHFDDLLFVRSHVLVEKTGSDQGRQAQVLFLIVNIRLGIREWYHGC